MAVPLFPKLCTQLPPGAGQQSRHRSHRNSHTLGDLALGESRCAHHKQLPRRVAQCIQRGPHGALALPPFHLFIGQRSLPTPHRSPRHPMSPRLLSSQTVAKRVFGRSEEPAPEFLSGSADVLHNHTRKRLLGRVRSHVRIARHGPATPQQRGIDLFEEFSTVHPLTPGRRAQVRARRLGSGRVRR